MYKKTILFCSLMISLSLIIGSYLISSGMKSNANETLEVQSSILTVAQLCEQLGLSEDELINIIENDNHLKQKRTGMYDTYQYIPNMKLPNGDYVFLISEIEQWVQYKSLME